MYLFCTEPNKDQNIMAPFIKKYFILILFFASPIVSSLNGQNIEITRVSKDLQFAVTALDNSQKDDTTVACSKKNI